MWDPSGVISVKVGNNFCLMFTNKNHPLPWRGALVIMVIFPLYTARQKIFIHMTLCVSIWHSVQDIRYKYTHVPNKYFVPKHPPKVCLEPFSWSVCTSTSMSIVNKRKPFVMSLRNVPKLLCTVTLLMFISTSIWWRILMITHDFTRGDGAGQLLGEIIAGTLTA